MSERGVIDDVAWSPPRRRHGALRSAANGLRLPTGWIGVVLVALATDGVPRSVRCSYGVAGADRSRSSDRSRAS